MGRGVPTTEIVRDKDRSKCIDKARARSQELLREGNTIGPIQPPEFDAEERVWFLNLSHSRRRCCGGSTPADAE